MNYKLELVNIAVADVDRAIAFYKQIGFNVDHDHTPTEGLRFVQVTPPGSACSISFGTGLTEEQPGPAQLQVVVDDAAAARADLLERGIDPGDVQEMPWGKFVFFDDPDGNRWSVQEIPPR